MGRSLFGNTVAAAQTVLSQLCGNRTTNPGGFDTTTVSTDESALPGGEWRYDTGFSENNHARPRNSVAFQNIDWNRYFSTQDELGNYSYVQGLVYNNNSAINYSRIFDADLNLVTSFQTSTYSDMFAVRLYNNNLYILRLDNSNFRVTKIALPSEAATTYTFALPTTGFSTGRALAFNWPIGGKFWVAISSSAGASSQILVCTFDIASNVIAQQFSSITNSSVQSILHAMHVTADGLSVSVPTYRSDGYYGVAKFDASSSTWQSIDTSGHFQNPYNGTWRVFCTSEKHLCPVTEDCVIDRTSIIYWDGSSFHEALGHLRGGDQQVQRQIFSRGANYWPYASGMCAHPSLTTKNLLLNQPTTQIGGSGTYSASRSGTTLTFTKVNEAYVSTPVTSKIPGNFLVALNASNGVTSISVRETQSSAVATYTYAQTITAQNSFGHTISSNPYYTSFVTSKGKFYVLPASDGASSGNTRVVKGQLPVVLPDSTKSYKATVIGGGGASSGSSGDSSSFAGIAAAAGQNRTGYVAGSTILTSGPTRGTGGTGYGADAWGQGEDTSSSGTFGGGSGYVAFGNVTLEAGKAYFYAAGFGPQYGKQGAILLEQI